MLRQQDLDAAVDANVITRHQAETLLTFAQDRRKARAFAVGDDERFHLLKGFNDFFISVGVVLLGIGIWISILQSNSNGIVSAIGVGAMWLLAEYLTGRKRFTAPSILIAGFLVAFTGYAVTAWFNIEILPITDDNTLGLKIYASALLCTSILHYWRFRLPFTLLLIACTATLLIFVIVFSALGMFKPEWTTKETYNVLMPILFLCGLAVFAGAMRYDMTDLERLTRRADCGFWLHLAAAPMIVHPLIYVLTVDGNLKNASSALIVVALTICLALVALAINRRALLVATLGYLGAAIAYGVSQVSNETTIISIVTLIFLGAMIILLGVSWHPLRAALMKRLPQTSLTNKFPPYKITS